MPTLKIIKNIKINMYFKDHPPPHFHICVGSKSEVIEIATLNTYAGGGTISIKARKQALLWAGNNLQFLLEKWNEFNP